MENIEMIRLSIIVPIYNVELYLRKCVDSLLCQDLNPEEYEIILVDDGSPDGCPAICDEYANASSPSNGTMLSIIAIHQANRGLSGARNSGIRIARGKYVMFVDSDDYLQPNVLHNLVDQMEREQLDVLRYNYQNVHLVHGPEVILSNPKLKKDGKFIYASPVINVYEAFEPYKQPHFVDYRTDITNGEIFLNERMGYACYATAFIINRSILDDCVFTEGIHFEDVEWTPRMLLKAQRVNSTSKIVYNYLLRKGSITGATTIAAHRRNVEDILTVIGTLNRELQQHPHCQWLRNMRSTSAVTILTTVASNLFFEYPHYLKRLKALNAFPLTLANQGRTYIRRARLINKSPVLFSLLMRLRSMAKRTL